MLPLKLKNSDCFRFLFYFRFVWATETKALPLVSVGPSSARRLPRPNSLRSLRALDHEFLVGKRALTERRPLGISSPIFTREKFWFVSKMSKTQNQKNMYSLNKNICVRCTDFVYVRTVRVGGSISLNAVEAGGLIELTDCKGPMRRIVQIPFEELEDTIRVNPGCANAFSVGPSGPILVNVFELLTPWDPSGSPGEPWGATGTLGEFNGLTFEVSKRFFANSRQAPTPRTTWTTTSSTCSPPPLGSAAAGLVGRCVLGVCVPVCVHVRMCMCMCLCVCPACRPLSSAGVCPVCVCVCLCLPVCRPVGQSVCQSACLLCLAS